MTQPFPPQIYVIKFISHGLNLLVGQNLGPTYHFIVSLDTLRTASPVLDKLCNTEYTSANLTLADDDPALWLITLNILYKRLEESREVMKGARLVRLASFCEKYDLVNLYRGHLDSWLERIEQSEQQISILDRLWIYWVFGYPMKAKQMMAHAIIGVKRNKDGQWIMSGSGKLIEEKPVGLLGRSNPNPINGWQLTVISTSEESTHRKDQMV